MTDQPDQVAGADSAPGSAAEPPPAPELAPAPAPPPVTPQPVPSAGWGAPPSAAVAGWGGGATATPRPSRPRGTSGRTALVVLVVIIGVVFGANIVNAALPLPEDPAVVDPGPGLPGQEQPSELPQPAPTDAPVVQPGETSVPVRTLPPLEPGPPAESAAPVEPGPVAPGQGVDVGSGFVVYPPSGWTAVGAEGGAVYQKSGVLIIVAGLPWDQTALDLATVYRDAWFAGGEFTGDEPGSGQLGNGMPAAGLNYTGLWNGNQVDGAIIAAAGPGAGLIVNIVGPTGTVNAVSADIDLFLNTIQFTGG